MRLTLVRKAAIALAAVAGTVGLSMAAPVAAHAEEPAAATQTLSDPSLYEDVTVGTVDDSSLYERRTIVAVIVVDVGGGCTQYFFFYSDGSVRTTVRCIVVIQG